MTSDLPDPSSPIDDATLVFRWIPRDQIVSDLKLGRYRPSTNAFKNTTGTDRMSVYVQDTLEAEGRSADEFLSDLRSVGSLETGFLRNECEQAVERSPEEGEPAHAEVVGSDRKRLLKKMAAVACCVEGDWETASRC